MHDNKIVHRDIKPANILIGDLSEGKLSDFGLALKNISKLDVSSIKQYQYWTHLAPEVKNSKDYSVLSDIYACGVTMYRLVNGDSYLPQLDNDELRNKAIKGHFPNRNKYREFIPRNLKTIINRAMNINPKNRYHSATEMRRAIERIPIKINIFEKIIPSGIHWFSADCNQHISLIRKIESKKYKIFLKRGNTSKTMRKITKHCYNDLNKDRAIKITKKILQVIVSGNKL